MSIVGTTLRSAPMRRVGEFHKATTKLRFPPRHLDAEHPLYFVLVGDGMPWPPRRERVLMGGDRLHPVTPTKPPPSGRGGMEYLRIARSSWDSWRGVTGFTLAQPTVNGERNKAVNRESEIV